MHITTLGIDVAKTVFQLHGVDARGRLMLSRRVKRTQVVEAVASLPSCVIGRRPAGVRITGVGRLNSSGIPSS